MNQTISKIIIRIRVRSSELKSESTQYCTQNLLTFESVIIVVIRKIEIQIRIGKLEADMHKTESELQI